MELRLFFVTGCFKTAFLEMPLGATRLVFACKVTNSSQCGL